MELIVLLVFFVLMWVLFILPQQRRVKAQEQYVASLEVGDEVVTAGGIHGTIVGLDAATVELEVAEGVVLTLARGAVARSQADAEPEPDQPDQLEDEAVADPSPDTDLLPDLAEAEAPEVLPPPVPESPEVVAGPSEPSEVVAESSEIAETSQEETSQGADEPRRRFFSRRSRETGTEGAAEQAEPAEPSGAAEADSADS